jgi:cholest-4-en-3-one 26-monooxygenase
MRLDIDPLDLVDPTRFALHGYPHEVWTRLRAEAPVAYVEPPGHPPFWAVTKHADIQYAASQPQLFSSAGGITLDMDLTGIEMPAEMIVYLDPPQHGPMRQVANKKFLRSAVRARSEEIHRIAADLVDQASTGGDIGECDFVDTFAAPFPVAVISWVLGVPPDDWKHHFRWTNEIIGKDDPEYRLPGESPEQTSLRARGELHRYFTAMVADRRQSPQDDLVTQLVQSEIDGVPLTRQQLVTYCELLVEAGNQTTRDAIAGGIQAFCEFPDQWEKLRAHPELLPDAVEEILRWTANCTGSRSTPVTRWRCTGRRPTATRRCSRIRSSSVSTVRRDNPSSSVSVRTCAWVHTWPGPSSRPCSASSSTAWSGSNSQARWNVSTRRSTAPSSICPSGTA